jgi:membrane protein required for colicin V production
VNLLDVLLVIIVGCSVMAGFMAGFARVGVGFIATITGILCGFWFYGIPAGWVHQYIKSVTASNLIGFLTVFFALVFAGALVGRLLSKLFRWTGLSWLDRLLGSAFGFVRGALIAVAFIAVLLAFTPTPTPTWMVNSKVLPYVIEASHITAALAPAAIKDAFRESMLDVRKACDEQLTKQRREKELKGEKELKNGEKELKRVDN